VTAVLPFRRKVPEGRQPIVCPEYRKRRMLKAAEVSVQKAHTDAMPTEAPLQRGEGIDARQGGPRHVRLRRAGGRKRCLSDERDASFFRCCRGGRAEGVQGVHRSDVADEGKRVDGRSGRGG